MGLLVVLPILIPLLSAAATLAFWRSARLRAALGVGGSVVLLAAAVALLAAVWRGGVQAVQIGDWPAPFGITLIADLFGGLMVLIAAGIGCLVAVYSVADIDGDRQAYGYFPLLHLCLMGVCGAFLAGDIFNLYVWFEVLLIASFGLLALGGRREQLEGALKYVVLNLISSIVFLVAVGILYGTLHTLNMAHLALRMPALAAERPHLLQAVALLFVVCFGIKAAIFPLFFWAPPAYTTPPSAVSAMFAGLLTKVGVYALVRVFTLVLPDMPGLFELLLVASGLTMVIGVLGAVAQTEMRRILAFHSVSQIGYMLAGLGLLVSPAEPVRVLGLVAALYFITHHSVVKTNLFLISGAVWRLRGTYQLKPLGGLAFAAPLLGALFFVSAFSLAGLPPFTGFWAKLAVVRAGLAAGQGVIVAAALVTGFLTLLSMLKIWNEAFWKPAPAKDGNAALPPPPRAEWVLRLAPIAALAVLTALLGFFPEPLLALAERAAGQVLHPHEYVQAVNLQLPDAERAL